MNDLKQKYQQVIQKLSEIYNHHQTINDYNDNPVPEINEYIDSLNAIEAKNDKANYDLALRLYIKKLKCFRWRFVNKTNAGDVWNPFFESYDAFIERAGEIDHWYTDKPFPSEEIIENWIKSHVKNSENKSNKATTQRPTG